MVVSAERRDQGRGADRHSQGQDVPGSKESGHREGLLWVGEGVPISGSVTITTPVMSFG